MSDALYEKLGAEAAVTAVVDRFYEKVLGDSLLKPVFERAGTDIEHLKAHQRRFVSAALGGPQYSGRSMKKAHEGLGITSPQFERVVEHLAATLVEFKVEATDIATIAGLLSPLKGEIVEA